MNQKLDIQSRQDRFHNEMMWYFLSTYQMDIVDKNSSLHLDNIHEHMAVVFDRFAYIHIREDRGCKTLVHIQLHNCLTDKKNTRSQAWMSKYLVDT